MKIALDFDGTLVDAKKKQMILLNSVLKSYDLVLDINSIWDLKRTGMSNKEALLYLGLSPILIDSISKFWTSNIETIFWSSFDTLFDDALSFLHTLEMQKYEISLITARKNNFVLKQQLMRLNLNQYFDQVYRVDSLDAIKHKSEILKNLNPQYFIGDSEVDLLSARDAGIEFIGVDTGQRSREFLTKLGGVSIFNSLNDCLLFINKHHVEY